VENTSIRQERQKFTECWYDFGV